MSDMVETQTQEQLSEPELDQKAREVQELLGSHTGSTKERILRRALENLGAERVAPRPPSSSKKEPGINDLKVDKEDTNTALNILVDEEFLAKVSGLKNRPRETSKTI